MISALAVVQGSGIEKDLRERSVDLVSRVACGL